MVGYISTRKRSEQAGITTLVDNKAALATKVGAETDNSMSECREKQKNTEGEALDCRKRLYSASV